MKKVTLLLVPLIWIPLLGLQPVDPTPPADEIGVKVQALMAKMELIDKIGEMTQYTIDVLEQADASGRPLNTQELDSARLRKILVDMRVGSILNVTYNELTLEKWRAFIETIQRIATTEKPSGIPVLYGIDAVHGTNYTQGATLFPQQIGLAATFNRQLVKELNQITAYETRASYIPWNFAPVMDIGRDVRWSRLWEGFGEDVYLAQQMGIAATEGLQGDDISDPYQIAACLKHFMGYSLPISGKDRTQAYIPERQLREYVMPPFQAAIDAGASTVMICSGEVNGVPVHASKWILTDLLRTEMGFKGLAVTDWDDITFLYTRHKVAKDYKEAIMLGINAGIDMVMVPKDLRFPRLLKELVEEGKVPMSRINESVARILRVKFELGLFEHPYPQAVDYSKFGGEEFAAKAFQGALESIVLCKNEENLLPLKKSANVLVTGPTASSMIPLNGGWTHSWQGNSENLATLGKQTILDAMKAMAASVAYEPGTSIDAEIDISAAVKAAKKVDAIVLCLGEMSYTEKPGDLFDLDLPAAQRQLWEALSQTGKPLIVVLAEGRPRTFGELEEKADAILVAPLPGNEGGRAIASMVFGDHNPCGRLPYTYPKYANSLETYDHKHTDEVDGSYRPLYEFGHGLSYTKFVYSKFKVSPETINRNDTLEVSVTIKNTGSRAGMESVLVFVSDKVASITPPVKRLRAFEKIKLEPGASQDLTFKIAADQLAFVGQDMNWVLEPGEFELTIGRRAFNFTLE